MVAGVAPTEGPRGGLATHWRTIALGLLGAAASAIVYRAVLRAVGYPGGWPLALLLVASMYVHEIGHVATLSWYGIAASAPIFIPGFGAFVRLRRSPASVRQDARIGLAGPLWGLAACLIAFGVYGLTRASLWASVAQAAAFINLVNLVPLWQLDGGRGFRSLSRLERYIAAAALVTIWLITRETLVLVLLVGAVVRAGIADAPRPRDWSALATYVALAAALSWLAAIPVSGGSIFRL